MKELGKITHYYPKIEVAIVELKAPIKIGDKILIKGSTTNFEQIVESMQIQHKDVQLAEAGKSIGLKVVQRVREGDIVYTAT
ncbi:MAG: translation elongation factor-like protein [archaeon]|nr:translation elongation factor-like protein [archaeon]MCP8314104.1 translation elongation factor-like protein [archaeon]MCP8318010.1 translation elongation factor-like protein [archaeon]